MILVVAGVAGSGKTTIGRLVAGRLHCEFADGDAFHPKANIEKMEAGIPLTDDDRWPWLRAIVAWMDARAEAGESAVVACSALRRAYRDVLLSGAAGARMVFLVVPLGDDEVRVAHRAGHFFPQALLQSQFAALELPEPPEPVALVPAVGTPGQTADRVMEAVGLQPGRTDTPTP
jgi:gluconokinase